MTLTLVGYPASPHFRTVSLLLNTLGYDYEIDSIDLFSEQQLQHVNHGRVQLQGELADLSGEWQNASTLCEQLSPVAQSLSDPNQCSSAELLMGFADTSLARAFDYGLFQQRVFKPYLLQQSGDQEIVALALSKWIPNALSTLEMSIKEAPAFTDYPVPGFAIASMIQAGLLAGYRLPIRHYPHVTTYLCEVLASSQWQAVMASEQTLTELSQARADWGYSALA